MESKRRKRVHERLKREARKCKKCGATDELTIDHILARGLGGTNRISNLQVLCFTCNNGKSKEESRKANEINGHALSLAKRPTHELQRIFWRLLERCSTKLSRSSQLYADNNYRRKTIWLTRRSMGTCRVIMTELNRRGVTTGLELSLPYLAAKSVAPYYKLRRGKKDADNEGNDSACRSQQPPNNVLPQQIATGSKG